MDTKIDRDLDLRGLKCPMPMVRCGLAIKEMAVGEVLRAVADDPATMKDIPAWASVGGHDLLLAEERDGVCTYVVRRGA